MNFSYYKEKPLCLNPCFNGRYSRSLTVKSVNVVPQVLILVLMEDTLGVNFSYYKEKPLQVLILVLMEDTLGALSNILKEKFF